MGLFTKEEKTNLKTAEEAKATEAPAKKEKPLFIPASEASEKAEGAFRNRMGQIIREAYESGLNHIELEVTHVSKEVVERFMADARKEGYSANVGNIANVSKGRTETRLTIKF